MVVTSSINREREKVRNNSPIELYSLAEQNKFINELKPEFYTRNLYVKEKVAMQPRGGLSNLEKQKKLWECLKSAGSDVLPLTIDSNTRLNDYKQAKKLLQRSEKSGADTLNGYPLLAIPIDQTKNAIEELQKPISLRHGTPDARLLVEAALNVGIMEIEGGGISYVLPYSKNYPVEMSISNWAYIDRVIGEYNKIGIPIIRESFGPLTSTLVPPIISIIVQILELALAVEEGVKYFSVSFTQTGSTEQDIAISTALKHLSRWIVDYIDQTDDVEIYFVYHQWMGAFPQQRTHADMLLAYATISGLRSNVDKIVLKTRDEALGVPSLKANSDAVNSACYMRDKVFFNVGKMEDQQKTVEAELLIKEAKNIIKVLLKDKSLKLTESVCKSIQCGMIDVPFSPHIANKGLLSGRRAYDGSIRVYMPGRVPFTEEFLEFERTILTKDVNIAYKDNLDETVDMILHYASLGEI